MSAARSVLGLCIAASVALAAAGCAFGNQLLSSHDEYELYRSVHLAPTVEERLAAGHRYLKSDPEGRYAPEIQAWFQPAETSYVEGAWNSLPRLRAYLAAMPDGPSAERVRARVEELRTTIQVGEKRERERERRAAEHAQNLERAAEQRQAFLDEIKGWLVAFGSVRSWDKPLAELGSDITSRFGGAVGDACVEDLCSKALAPRFAIPVQDKIAPREAAYTVELALEQGVVVEARLRGRELFSRLGEALDRRAVSFSDPQSRAEGIGRAIGFVTNALGDAWAADGCERPAVSPVVLERACGGVRVVATAALVAGDDDSIVFGREVSAALATPAKGPAGGTGKAAPAAPKGNAP